VGSLLRPLLLADLCAVLPSAADNLFRLHGLTVERSVCKAASLRTASRTGEQLRRRTKDLLRSRKNPPVSRDSASWRKFLEII